MKAVELVYAVTMHVHVSREGVEEVVVLGLDGNPDPVRAFDLELGGSLPVDGPEVREARQIAEGSEWPTWDVG